MKTHLNLATSDLAKKRLVLLDAARLKTGKGPLGLCALYHGRTRHGARSRLA